jgi:hypothetical protein
MPESKNYLEYTLSGKVKLTEENNKIFVEVSGEQIEKSETVERPQDFGQTEPAIHAFANARQNLYPSRYSRNSPTAASNKIPANKQKNKLDQLVDLLLKIPDIENYDLRTKLYTCIGDASVRRKTRQSAFRVRNNPKEDLQHLVAHLDGLRAEEVFIHELLSWELTDTLKEKLTGWRNLYHLQKPKPLAPKERFFNNFTHRANFSDAMDKSLSLDDLKHLCFLLGIDYDNVAGARKIDKIMNFILTIQRTMRMKELVNRLTTLRPNVDWESIPSGEPAD